MAEILNVTQATYSRYETGEIDVPISIIIKLAEYFETSIDYLVGLSNEEHIVKNKQNSLCKKGSNHIRRH